MKIVVSNATEKTMQGIFDEIAYSMKFPNYYGHNYDAFLECVSDLSWSPSGVDNISYHIELHVSENKGSSITEDIEKLYTIKSWIEESIRDKIAAYGEARSVTVEIIQNGIP